MGKRDSNSAQRDVLDSVAAQLAAVGFDDAHEVGRGGFGVVYRCRQSSLERTVAVKVLTTSFASENLERFLREQRAMGRLSGHPNIVNVLEAGATSSGLPYIAMPYHPKDSLERVIRESGPLEWGAVVGLGVKIAGALETAHRFGILHRDVKPANILLTDYGDPQLTDFGIAHMAGAFETATGVLTGSPAFTAPEILAGEPPSAACDIYSLGATLFCALTGHAPFERLEGEQVVAQFLRIATQPLPELRGRQSIPDDVAVAIEQSMARDPADRPTTAAVFGDELRSIEQHHNYRIDDMAIPPNGTSTHRNEPLIRELTGLRTERASIPHQTTGLALKTGLHSLIPPGTQNLGHIPLELTSFVGRRRELAAAKNLLSSSRLVTLIGMGGVGKTRLALRLASDNQQKFADGVCLVELGKLQDATLVDGTVAAELGIRNQSAAPPLHQIVGHLLNKDLLLVLDNCEHLVNAVATLAEALLRRCPGLKILATSREPLGCAGEQILRVPPMTVPDSDRHSSLRVLPSYESVTLFVERASAAVPGFELSEDNYSAVAQICRRLDGLPLPIELAAVRLRAMTPQQVLERLTDRYRLLTVGSRVAPSRQQTLQLCIDWSYDLCTPSEQLAWARVAVFAGSFELDAAEAICRDDDSPVGLLDILAQLVDKSILIREESGRVVRYRLLDTLREYGLGKLQGSGEYTELRRRHRDWYEKLVMQAENEWISSRQLEWITRLERERPNLHEALRLCLNEPGEVRAGQRIAASLFPLWVCRGLLSEGRSWFDRVLATDDTPPPTAERAKALCSSSILAGLQDDFPAAHAQLAEGLEIIECLHDDSVSALAEHAAGAIALYSGDSSTAVARSEAAVNAASNLGYEFCQAGALTVMGVGYVLLGDPAQAAHCHEEMLAITEARGELVYRGRSSLAGGWAMWRKGDTEQAKNLLESGLLLSSRADDTVGLTRSLQVLAWIEADQHHAERAAVLLGANAGRCHDIGGPAVGFLGKLTYHKECENLTRKSLGESRFRTYFERGSKLNLREATAYALDKKSAATPTQSTGEPSLTRREHQVAELVAEGLTNRAIATRLVISQRTVQGHVEHILAKLGFTSRTQIAAWVLQ
ncbi:protein kinase [Rhodococcus sp. NPDC057529]|uniref:protein kinase domain-containing protein n=1 Tax=Rhodococcus sp. NPDC057529 TaxID=3346158 RepID=UPI0036729AAE